MSGWARKRFWKEVTTGAEAGGFAVLLDGRPLRTPAKTPLILPSPALADMVAAEWAAQGEVIDPESMPATRAANAAIDKVTGQFPEVAAMLAAYGDTDLLCYRAEAPAELVAEQARAWDPLLDWAARRYGVRFAVTAGVMPATQPPETLATLAARVHRLTPFQLTAFHDLVALSGSLVIALAVTENHDTPDSLWQASRIDEDWQARQWGADDEARQQAARRRDAFLQAAKFFGACPAE
jgi:chaperone required for assembly of F1-ATPase